MIKFLSIAIKDSKELLRDRKGLFLILGFPLFFMLIFGFAFGGMGQENETHNLAIVNYDQGAVFPTTNAKINFGNNLTTVLKDTKYEDSETHIFNVTKTTENNANNIIKNSNADALLIIPKNFSQAMVNLLSSNINQNALSSSSSSVSSGSTSSNSNVTAKLIIRGDSSSVSFGVSQAILVGIIGNYQDQVVNNVKKSVSGSSSSQIEYIKTDVESASGTSSFTTFDFLAPGMMVFAILLLATTVASGLTREVESGTLKRLKLSKMRSFDLLFGGLIPWSLIAALQILILLGVAIAIGFHWQGGTNSIILAMIVAIIGGVASVALGMIIASFAQNDRQATNLGTLVTVPVSFLSGAFFQLPQVVMGNFMGNTVEIYDLLPWRHTLLALRRILIYGGNWNDISYQVAWMVVLTVILFVIGVVLFSKMRLQAEK
ncbi:MAG: ABC transporter permease [Methanobacteriaceae archaeon]|jgi:ABC-2 type transport system permease protein|nr:ABC transporter permease [Methanobacteriaceae archaeon]MDO9626513.1 ABC transporter permease [Methanobacteriaceae archaeon]